MPPSASARRSCGDYPCLEGNRGRDFQNVSYLPQISGNRWSLCRASWTPNVGKCRRPVGDILENPGVRPSGPRPHTIKTPRTRRRASMSV